MPPPPPDPPEPDSVRLAPLTSGLVDHERTRPAERLWSLDTIRALLSRPGARRLAGRAVQVAGSKGKGTTCLFAEALARGAGLTVGTYLSPHVSTVRERVRLHGAPVGIDELERALRGVVDFAREAGLRATFFEAMTAAAVEVFAAAEVDLALLEVGLGGRYDATTAVEVDASVVTGIELEHVELLGDTVAAIAAEKAQVIRPASLAVTGTSGEALAVVAARAEEVGARLLVLGRDFDVLQPSWTGGVLHGELLLPGGAKKPFHLPDARGFEVPALALAAATLATLFPDRELPLDPVPRPVAAGRFEVISEPDGEALVLDGAHTETSLRAVADEVRRRWPGRPAAVLFASAVGKRWREGLSALLGLADRFLVTGLSGTPGENPETIRGWLEEHGARAEVVADIEGGLRELRRHPGPRLVTGSFYLVGRVRGRVVDETGTKT